MKKVGFLITMMIMITIACSLPPPNNLDINLDITEMATAVAGTLEASIDESQPNTSEPQLPTDVPPEDIYNTGTAEGNVCFPSEYVPAMTLYLENVNTQEVTIVPIPENEPQFSAPLPPGTYIAYAWLKDFSGGGTYSQAVPCGLSVDCTDHSMLEFEIVSGQITPNIQVCDWYGAPSDVPVPPDVDANAIYGAISGELGYPSEGIPALQIVAFNLGTQQYYYIEVPENTFNYTIENLPPGSYHVVAYPMFEGGDDFGGGYSEFVLCGQTVDCLDHSLVTVQVSAGQTTTDINPVDFYAPEGTFPTNPVP